MVNQYTYDILRVPREDVLIAISVSIDFFDFSKSFSRHFEKREAKGILSLIFETLIFWVGTTCDFQTLTCFENSIQ